MLLPRTHHLRLLLPYLAALLSAATATAAPPTVTALTPHGAEPGKAIDLILTGTNLTPQTRLLLPFAATQQVLPDAKPLPTQVRIQLTVDAKVHVGIYPIRVVTDDGVSAPLPFAVDALPNVAEVEDNSSFDKAQKVPVPCVINGQCAGGDVDFFRFTAKKGQSLVIEAQSARLGSGVLPQLRLTDAGQRFLAGDDTQALAGDARLHFVAPADGDYVVEISDSRYRGAAPPHYRLKIGDYDFAEEVFPLGYQSPKTEFTLRGGTLKQEVRFERVILFGVGGKDARPPRHVFDLGGVLKPGSSSLELALGTYPEQRWTAGPGQVLDVKSPLTVNGRLAVRGERHHFQLAVQPGQRYRFTVEAEALGSRLDALLRVNDQAGKQLAVADDVDLPPPAPGLVAFKSLDPVLDFTVPAGVTQLKFDLADSQGRGGVNFGYRLTVEPAVDDFLLHVAATEFHVPRGGAVAVPVTVTRRGYNGPILLGHPSLTGFQLQGGYVPEGATAGVLTLSAAPDARQPNGPLELSIRGVAVGVPTLLERWTTQLFVVSRDANVAVAVKPLSTFTVALTSADPVTLKPPARVEVVAGYSVPVPVALLRGDKVKAAVEVTGVSVVGPPAPGKQPLNPLTFKPGTAAVDANQADFTLTAAINAPAGRAADVIVQGKVKVNNVDKIVVSQALEVTIKRPVEVVLLTPKLTLTPGKAEVFKGRLDRAAVFKEAVTLKLDGLPKGVTLAKPLQPVAGTQGEFQIELNVDAKAVAVSASLTLTAAATVNGQAYAHLPLTIAVEVKTAK